MTTGMMSRFYGFFVQVNPGERLSTLLGQAAANRVGWVGGGAFVVAACLALVSGLERRRLRRLATGFFLLALAITAFSWVQTGLIAACPFLLLPVFLRRREGLFANPTTRLVILTAILYMVLCSLFLPNSEGAERYLLPITLPLTLVVMGLLIRALEDSPVPWLKTLLVLCMVCALFTEVKAVTLDWRAAAFSRASEKELAGVPLPLVLEETTVIYHAPKPLWTVPCLQANDEDRLGEVVRTLRQNGIFRFTVLAYEANKARRLGMIEHVGATVVEKHELSHCGLAYVVEIPAVAPRKSEAGNPKTD
jgi:hypothetical protein